MKKNEVKKLASEAREIMETLKQYKDLYKRLDEITDSLHGQDLSGVGLAIVDNFESKSVVWKPCGVRRFELKKVS